jgi:hypothetical protein
MIRDAKKKHTHTHALEERENKRVRTAASAAPMILIFSMVRGATKGLTRRQSVANTQGAETMKMFSITSG